MRKVFINMSVVLNIIFLAAAITAYFMLPSWIDKFFAVPIYERWTTFFDAYPVESGDVVFLGDSITEGAKWGEMFPAVSIKNRGISADTSRGVLARLEQVTQNQPAKIFINIGTNDLGQDVSEAVILSNYKKILGQINQSSPQTRIYVQSLLPRGASFQTRIENLNTQLALLAREHNQTYIDLYTQFLDTDGSIKNALSNDELHLLGAGYSLWQGIIEHHVTD